VIDANLIAPERPRSLRRSEYDRLVSLGVFGEERVELLQGTLIAMSPQGTLHAEVVARLTELLILGLGGRATVRVQAPFAASDDSEPEPDVAVVPRGNYSDDHPSKAFLLVEVADSSRRKDREVKPGVYAAAGATEYWLVDLIDRKVEAWSNPVGSKYTRHTISLPGGTLRPVAFPDMEVRVDDILPARSAP
jgi:Uma2 family endonuclease